MSETKIYYNPSCSKSRQTLGLLQERDCEIEIINYLETPPTPEELDDLCREFGKEPLELIRKKERRFLELGLSQTDNRTRQEWINIMCENPILIERPIVVHKNKAALGRPPENVIQIL